MNKKKIVSLILTTALMTSNIQTMAFASSNIGQDTNLKTVEAVAETVLSGTEHLNVKCSSEETQGESSGAQGQAAKVIDGNRNSYWHSQYQAKEGTVGNQQNKEHYVILELKQGITEVKSVNYLPRQHTEEPNGTLRQYEIYVSTTGTDDNDFTKAGHGQLTWNNWNNQKGNFQTLDLYTPVYARYVKLVWPARNAKGGQATAAEITVTVGEQAKAPSAPNVNVTEINQTGAKLTWEAPTDAPVTGYQILNSDDELVAEVNADVTEHLLTNLVAGKQYSYKVVAKGEFGLNSTAAEVSFATNNNNNDDNNTLTLTDINFLDNIQAGVENTIDLVTTKTDSTVYKLEVYNTREGWKTIESTFEEDNNGNVSVSWRPTSQGQNLVRVTAKDNLGKVLRVNKWVTVNNNALSLNGFEVEGDLQIGEPQTIALNGTINLALEDSVNYKLEVYNTTEGWNTVDTHEENIDNQMDNRVLTWLPKKVGENLVRLTVKDSSGKVVTYQKWVTVKNDTLELTGFNLVVENQEVENVVVGNTVTIVPVGGTTESTEYTYEVYDTTNGWSSVKDGQWTPDVANKYLVRVTAKDNSGKTLRVNKWVNVVAQ